MWPTLFYVNSLLFNSETQIGAQHFSMHPYIQNCDFWVWLFGCCTSNFFLIKKKDWQLGFVNVGLVGVLKFFPIHEGDWILIF